MLFVNNLESAAQFLNIFYDNLSIKKLPRGVPCQKFHLSLSCETSKLTNIEQDVAKIQIKLKTITTFCGFFPIMDEFDRVLSKKLLILHAVLDAN